VTTIEEAIKTIEEQIKALSANKGEKPKEVPFPTSWEGFISELAQTMPNLSAAVKSNYCFAYDPALVIIGVKKHGLSDSSLLNPGVADGLKHEMVNRMGFKGKLCVVAVDYLVYK